MVNEPLHLPTYSTEIFDNRWYCFHCDQHRMDANSLRVHLGAQHDNRQPVPGCDFGDGEMVKLIRRQREMWELEVAVRFARQLDSQRGADDFVIDAGGKLPDA